MPADCSADVELAVSHPTKRGTGYASREEGDEPSTSTSEKSENKKIFFSFVVRDFLSSLRSNPSAILKSQEAHLNVATFSVAILFFFVFLLWAPHVPGQDLHHSVTQEGTYLASGLGATPYSHSFDLSNDYDVLEIRFAAQKAPATVTLSWSIVAATAAPSTVTIDGPTTLKLSTRQEEEGGGSVDVDRALRRSRLTRKDLTALEVRIASFDSATNSTPPIGLLTDMRQMGSVGNHRVMIAGLILGLTYLIMITDVVSKALVAIIGSFVGLAAVFAIQGAEHLETVVVSINFPTLAIIFGMMLMVGMLATTGFIEWVGVQSVVLCNARPWRLVVVLGAVSWIMGALMDCVTTMCVVVPIALSTCRLVGLDNEATSFIIISMAIFGNTGGAATLVGDPPNIVLGSQIPNMQFIDFIVYQSPGVLMATIPLVAFFYFRFGRKLRGKEIDLEALRKETRIHSPGKLFRNLLIVSLALLLMFLVPVHKQDLGWIAVCYAVLLMLVSSPRDLSESLSKVDFETLLYLGGLFVLVQACVQLGLMRAVGQTLGDAVRGVEGAVHRRTAAYALILGVSAGICTLVDNTAYTISMVPVIIFISEDLGIPMKPLAFSLSMGACLGANSSIYGAAANSVIVALAKKDGLEIPSRRFSVIGAPATLILVATTMLYAVVVFGIGGFGA